MPLKAPRVLVSTASLALVLTLGCAGGSSSPSSSTTSATAIPTAAPGRGIWFWESQAQQAIVAGTSSQDATIANFKSWGVTSVYGSYQNQIASSPTLVRAWNAKLAANGIASYSLISTANAFLPEQWSATEGWLRTNYLAFNTASRPGEGFVGIAFDVEPQSFTGDTTHVSWGVATPAQRRVYMTGFLDMMISTRAFLNTNSASSALIQIYIPSWYQSLTATIGWAGADDRNTWFAQLTPLVDRVAVSEYDSTLSAITASMVANNALLGNKGRAALEPANTVWGSISAFFTQVPTVETQTGAFVDIEDYDTTVQ